MEPGAQVLLRCVHAGRVRVAMPQHFVAEDAGRLIFYRRPGSRGRSVPRDAAGKYLDRWARADPTTESVSETRLATSAGAHQAPRRGRPRVAAGVGEGPPPPPARKHGA